MRFNPRTYIRYDVTFKSFNNQIFKFQSTYLYKVRHIQIGYSSVNNLFQSTYLYKVRPTHNSNKRLCVSFNPRTYIRYDGIKRFTLGISLFQSTYLYKVRRIWRLRHLTSKMFQSTYLYKVRPIRLHSIMSY